MQPMVDVEKTAIARLWVEEICQKVGGRSGEVLRLLFLEGEDPEGIRFHFRVKGQKGKPLSLKRIRNLKAEGLSKVEEILRKEGISGHQIDSKQVQQKKGGNNETE